MQSKINFDDSIQEVTYLNKVALEDANHDKIYFKVIILLLCAKLERYVKDSTKEYIDELLELNLTREALPEKFVLQILKNELQKINDVTLEKYLLNDKYRARSGVLSLIWDPKYVLKDIAKEEFAISISNNGTNAFEDMYSKIGFQNIIKEIKDYVQNDDVTTISISVKDQINRIIRIRHEIIHDDATPNLSPKDIDLFIEVSKCFVEQIDAVLSSNITEIKLRVLQQIDTSHLLEKKNN